MTLLGRIGELRRYICIFESEPHLFDIVEHSVSRHWTICLVARIEPCNLSLRDMKKQRKRRLRLPSGLKGAPKKRRSVTSWLPNLSSQPPPQSHCTSLRLERLSGSGRMVPRGKLFKTDSRQNSHRVAASDSSDVSASGSYLAYIAFRCHCTCNHR